MSPGTVAEHMRVVHRRTERHGVVTYVHPPGVHIWVQWDNDNGVTLHHVLRPAQTNCMATSVYLEPPPPIDDRVALEAWLDE